MEYPIKIDRIEQTCYGCPSQWNMYTADGDYIYDGTLSIDCNDKNIYRQSIGDNLDGFMSLEELAVYAHGILDLTQESEELIAI